MPILPDVLDYNLRIVFCGSAVGNRSAALGAYYAGPGNRFWPVLYETRLTSHQINPQLYATVIKFGIGLTDIAKNASGADSDLPKGADDRDDLERKITHFQPRTLAFNGKRAGAAYLGLKSVKFGLQPSMRGNTEIFILPSTSGAAKAFWDARYWFEFANFVHDACD